MIKSESAEVIRNALALHDSITEKYRRISGKEEEVSLRQLITDLGRLIRTATEESTSIFLLLSFVLKSANDQKLTFNDSIH